jgi:glycosyltransferase involved in cell wall biosynthesis
MGSKDSSGDRLDERLAEAQALATQFRRRIEQLERFEQTLRSVQRENRILVEQNHRADVALALALRAVEELQASSSWRLTAPVRAAKGVLRLMRLGISAWLLFHPGSRPRRTVRRLMVSVGLWPKEGRPASTEAAAGPTQTEVHTGPKRQMLYVVLDQSFTGDKPNSRQADVRALCAELTESPHLVRFVKWDAASNDCILLDRADLAKFGQWDGPILSPDEIGHYPAAGGAVRASPRPHSSSWLILAEPGGDTKPIIDWAGAQGLQIGCIVHEGLFEEPLANSVEALQFADAVWPTSSWAAARLREAWPINGPQATVTPLLPPQKINHRRVLTGRPAENLILYDAGQSNSDLSTLLAAFGKARADRPEAGWTLMIAGATGALTGDGVTTVNPLTSEAAADLYGRSAFSIVLGDDEAAQAAVLASLWEARPCVCPPTCLAAKDGGCLTVATGDSADLADAIGRMMDESKLRNMLADAAIVRPTRQWSDYRADMEAAGPGARPLIYYWVDSTIAVPVNTGIQRVVRQLARGLIEAGYDLVPVKWGNMDQPLYPVFDDELEHLAKWNGPSPEVWSAWVDPRTHRGGGWFMMNELPHNLAGLGQKTFRAAAEAAGLKTAAVFYDTIPWKMADIYPEEFARLHLSYIGELSNYDRVITISEYSRVEMKSVLSQEFQIPASQLDHVVAAPLAAEFPEKSEQEVIPRRRDDGAIEILCVGTVEPRKNHERLLDAFDIACENSPTPLHLTIVGGGHSFDPDLPIRVRERVDQDPRIDWEQKADDARIKQLYGRCDFTIYPSVEEGFGMPILESLWYGKPVICADKGAMLEVAAGGGGCVTVDVADAVAMASAITALANSPDRLRELEAEAKVRSFQTWDGYTRDVAEKMGLQVVLPVR